MFIGLLIDLLGKQRNQQPCTDLRNDYFQPSHLFCPSSPPLLATTETMIQVVCSLISRPRCWLSRKIHIYWPGFIPILRLMASVSWWEPQLNSTQCYLAAFWAAFSHFFRWQMSHVHYVIPIDFSVPGKSNHWRPQWSLRKKTPAVDVDSWCDVRFLNSDLYCEFIVLSGIALSYLLWVFSSNFTIFVMARILGGISKGW